ncbi:hypothetical protein HDV05_007750, partial [Chytridiales sp. JEL 0842]
MISSFISTALHAGEAAMMVSCPRNIHTVQILLEKQVINVAWAIKTGQLIMIDGYCHISELIEGGSVTYKTFHRLFGSVLLDLLSKWPQVVIYGDIVSGMIFESLNPNASPHLGDMAIQFETIYHKFQEDKPNLISLCGYWMEAFTSGDFAVDSKFLERFRAICRCHDHAGTDCNPVWDSHFKSEQERRKEEQMLLEAYMMAETIKKKNTARDGGAHNKSDCAPFLHGLKNVNKSTATRTNVTKGPVVHVDGGKLGPVTDIQKCIVSPTDPAKLIEVLKQRAESLQAELNAFKIKEASFTDAISILARSATESLRRERDVHNQILSRLPVGVLCAESWREQQMYVNKTFCEMVGCSEEDVMSGNWLNVIHPDDREKVRNLLMSSGQLCHRQDPVKLEYRIFSSKSNSKLASASTTASVSTTQDDTHQYKHEEEDLVWVTSETVKCSIKGRWVFVHAIVDTTEVKRVNAERILLCERESYQMKKAADADKRRLLLDEFIDGLCHELRNPLNGIVGNLDVLQTSLDDRKKLLRTIQQRSDGFSPGGKITIFKNELNELINQIEDEEASISTINTCATHSRVLADDVLSLSKIECNKMSLCNSSFCPKSLLGEVAKIMGPKAAAKNLDIRFNVPFTSPPFIADAFRVRQVVINLVSNAVVYTEEGSITLGLEYLQIPADGTTAKQPSSKRFNEFDTCDDGQPGTPRCSYRSDRPTASYLRISVSDTGVGMTQDEMNHLFQKFSQPTAAVSREQQYTGSGLGLVISKKLVELMGGWIEIESVKGVGSKFSFTIKEGVLTPEKPKVPGAQLHLRATSVGSEDGALVLNMANLPMSTS